MKLNFGKAAFQRSRLLEDIPEKEELEERLLRNQKLDKILSY